MRRATMLLLFSTLTVGCNDPIQLCAKRVIRGEHSPGQSVPVERGDALGKQVGDISRSGSPTLADEMRG